MYIVHVLPFNYEWFDLNTFFELIYIWDWAEVLTPPPSPYTIYDAMQLLATQHLEVNEFYKAIKITVWFTTNNCDFEVNSHIIYTNRRPDNSSTIFNEAMN